MCNPQRLLYCKLWLTLLELSWTDRQGQITKEPNGSTEWQSLDHTRDDAVLPDGWGLIWINHYCIIRIGLFTTRQAEQNEPSRKTAALESLKELVVRDNIKKCIESFDESCIIDLATSSGVPIRIDQAGHASKPNYVNHLGTCSIS